MDSVKTVGREPTPEMLDVAPASYSASFREIWPKICGDIWRAMWDAAPSAASPAGAEVVARDTPGPYEARYCAGIPANVCDYGVVSLSTGIEVCRVWKEQDARAIADLLNTPSTDAVRRQAREELLAEFKSIVERFKPATLDHYSASVCLMLDDIIEALRALSTPPAGAAALNEGEE